MGHYAGQNDQQDHRHLLVIIQGQNDLRDHRHLWVIIQSQNDQQDHRHLKSLCKVKMTYKITVTSESYARSK